MGSTHIERASRLEVVAEEEIPEAPTVLMSQAQQETRLLTKALQTTARMAAAKMAETVRELLLPLVAILGAFVLWRAVLPSPSEFQLIGLGLYGGFVVLPVIFRR